MLRLLPRKGEGLSSRNTRQNHWPLRGAETQAHNRMRCECTPHYLGKQQRQSKRRVTLGKGLEIKNKGNKPTFVTANEKKVLDMTISRGTN